MEMIGLIFMLIGMGVFGLGLWAGIINEMWPGFFGGMAVGLVLIWFGNLFA